MNIQNLIEWAHEATIAKGFKARGERRPVAEHVALMTTEIGELYEAHRDGQKPGEFWYEHKGRTGPDRFTRSAGYDLDEDLPKPVGIDFELADIVIRACDMAGEYGINLERAIAEKMAYNSTRPAKHGRQS